MIVFGNKPRQLYKGQMPSTCEWLDIGAQQDLRLGINHMGLPQSRIPLIDTQYYGVHDLVRTDRADGPLSTFVVLTISVGRPIWTCPWLGLSLFLIAYPVFTIDVRDCDRVFTFYTLHLVLNETLTLMTAAVPAEFGDGEKDEC